ncbi:M15 family metallopeptidase [Campylobacter pinnipediorum]
METFKYRNITGTNRLSTHSYAITIDINVKSSTYWRWHKNYKI